jgi:hypothetical protein
LISCTTTQPKEETPEPEIPPVNDLWLSFPYFPDPLNYDGDPIIKLAYPTDENGENAVTTDGENVTLPLLVWNRYFIADEEVILPVWYWLRIVEFVADVEEERAIYESWLAAKFGITDSK